MSLLFTGCAKDGQEIQISNESSQDYTAEVREKSFSSSAKVVQFGKHSMLEFPNQESFDNLVLELDHIQERRDDDFLATYASLSDEELESLETKLGYNYKQPLIDFENQINFNNSYRLIFEQGEKDYLDGLSTLDPENLTLMDETEHSLLNDKQRVKIGDKIFQYMFDGYIEITNDFEYNLDLIDQVGVDNVHSDNVRYCRNVCRWWVGKSDSREYNNNQNRVRLKVIFRGGVYDTRVKSKIINYKRKNGGWKRSRARIGTANQLYGYLDECRYLDFGQWSGWKVKNRKKVKKNNVHFHNAGIHSVKTGQVYAKFKYGTYSVDVPYYYPLTW